MRARDIMTPTIVTCTPDSPVGQVAKLMRDRNLGDIVVTENGRLAGIITDRDIAIRAAASGRDVHKAPIRDFMSKHPVTGQPNWSADKLAGTMARYQVRRLPIVENGVPVGIVSLGDLARTNPKKRMAQSLKEISEPSGMHRVRSTARRLASLAFAAMVGGVLAATVVSKAGSAVMHRLQAGRAESQVMETIGK